MSEVIELSKENFEKEIKDNKVVVIDFWAAWCGPCRTLSPILDELSEEMKGKVTFCKVNVDDNQELAAQHQIVSIPTVLIYKNGSQVDQFIGSYPKEEIIKKLQSVLEQN